MRAMRADRVFELQVSGPGSGRVGCGCRGGKVGTAARSDVLGLDVRADPGELAPLPRDAERSALHRPENARGRYSEDVAAQADEPAARDLRHDLRVEPPVPFRADAAPVAEAPPERLGLPGDGGVSAHHVRRFPFDVEIGAEETPPAPPPGGGPCG